MLRENGQPPAYAVVVAGGSGSRMGLALPKQFALLSGKPMLYWSLRAFQEALPGVQLVLVLPEAHLSLAQMVLQAFPERVDLTIVAGGDTRFASVANGIRQAPKEAIVLVHDAARPLVSVELIRRCYEAARMQGSAIPVVPVVDSIREETEGGNRAISREALRIVQTPQAFPASRLQAAFEQPYDASFTDEASVMERAGYTMHLVEGERANIKVTTPEDLVLAEALMQALGM